MDFLTCITWIVFFLFGGFCGAFVGFRSAIIKLQELGYLFHQKDGDWMLSRIMKGE